MKKFLFGVSLCLTNLCFAQHAKPSATMAHSHNDYEGKNPFHAAYNENFGSIEADIFLHNDSLIVSHHAEGIRLKRTLQRLYLDPLREKGKANKGFPYKDRTRSLQLLIDLKTDAVPALKKLMETLGDYPQLTSMTKLRLVISGNRPRPSQFASYPAYLWFDGELNKTYSQDELRRVPLFSANFKEYSNWNGEDSLSADDEKKLSAAIQYAHSLRKKIRFWNAPDVPPAWAKLKSLGADYINTDRIVELSQFLQTNNK